ncbi:MFS transporter [Sphingomonas sp. H160509]|uniref:MFS transporter n=1 Tax=Sphingomonas sp. H160509 TaxID=2955313 RepID=UPI002096D728|nr:MFS transporter [Sphingomonas sp. H160509]MDD1450125.1 MFS transporter [Sphingomonas sp. H160509]
MGDTGPMEPAEAGGSFITPTYRFGFVLIISLFFLWALANNFNDILIRQFQKSLGLDRAQAGFIQFVFYIGYFVVALPAGLLMRRFGYKAGILTGLLLYAGGALLFFPASLMLSYGAFLFALFMIAAGAACLETTANAYASSFGDPGTAVQRLNLAQAFNGLGACLAPVIGALLIFTGVEHSSATVEAMSPAALAAYRASEASTVQLPYTLLALAALLVAGAVAVTRLPRRPAARRREPGRPVPPPLPSPTASWRCDRAVLLRRRPGWHLELLHRFREGRDAVGDGAERRVPPFGEPGSVHDRPVQRHGNNGAGAAGAAARRLCARQCHSVRGCSVCGRVDRGRRADGLQLLHVDHVPYDLCARDRRDRAG